jgi:iron(III) transport system ATP-binding protein
MALVHLDQVTKRFGGGRPPATDRLSFTLESGRILALLGPSGCGKTTTLRLIAGFEAPDEGQIAIAGRTVADASRGIHVAPEARGVGVVFQDYALFPHLTVGQNVGFGLERASRSDRRARIAQVLGLVGLTEFIERYPHELSGGQRQRVAVARPGAGARADLARRAVLEPRHGPARADARRGGKSCAPPEPRDLRTRPGRGVYDRGPCRRSRPGRLERSDRPRHLPPSLDALVAEFVGAADFLPGVVTAEGVATEIGLFGGADGRAQGERVRVMIRPDDVTFVPDDTAEAVITRRYFRGSETLYCLGLPSGHRVHSSQPSSATFQIGLRVRPRAHVLHVVTFPAP